MAECVAASAPLATRTAAPPMWLPLKTLALLLAAAPVAPLFPPRHYPLSAARHIDARTPIVKLSTPSSKPTAAVKPRSQGKSAVRTAVKKPGSAKAAARTTITKSGGTKTAEKTAVKNSGSANAAVEVGAQDSASPSKPQLQLPTLTPSRIRRGDYVVHSSFGVGRFDGVFKSPYFIEDKVHYDKFLKVQFKDRALEIPTDQSKVLKLFRRQEEVDDYAPVKLDSTRARKSWERRKAKAAANVLEVAADLLKMYANRQQSGRPPCPPDGERFAKFESAFAYEPTPDQLTVFEDIRRDMCEGDRPMDRLVCGDVGFGKTEVAMRAAYRAICAGRQVAFLAPTTVLAAQHLRVISARMPDVRVEIMSSITKRTAAQRSALQDDVASGDVQLLIGTHAILTDKLSWSNLGLLIIDEEQRFGVRQKEVIKNASLMVDVLSMSATPIPRTMYMCMAGIRDMSTLETAPPGRLPVVTQVSVRDDEATTSAVRAELARGGQVFYVVPRIEAINREVQTLQRLIPELKISFAYGGIRDLEQRIVDFALGKVDLMVSTTIMENGIDIPNVNTIIVQDTQLFGLSQLHQLRGRVGRANLQAYALLMHPRLSELGDDAMRRLRVLQRESGFGAGFNLAKSDLHIRGAGNLFGIQQKGSFGAKEMGVDMYMMTLQRAMRFLEQKQREGGDEVDEAELLQAAQLDESLLFALADSLSNSES